MRLTRIARRYSRLALIVATLIVVAAIAVAISLLTATPAHGDGVMLRGRIGEHDFTVSDPWRHGRRHGTGVRVEVWRGQPPLVVRPEPLPMPRWRLPYYSPYPPLSLWELEERTRALNAQSRSFQEKLNAWRRLESAAKRNEQLWRQLSGYR